MLLVYQVGSVKIGEVVRYTVTYTPSQDRILPSPERLYLRIRNTSAIALRAAFVHGPYTLSAVAYPSNFDPNVKFANPRRYGVPEFEPMLKAGGSWECELVVPEHIRQSAGTGGGHFGGPPGEYETESVTWIVEVSSQVIFSTSAAVGYEVTIARDAKSLNLSYSLPVIGGQAQVPQPGKVADHQQSIGAKDGRHPAQPKGVFSKAIRLKVEDTAALWNTPRLPGWDDLNMDRLKSRTRKDQPVESVLRDTVKEEHKHGERPKKVHLVVLTHGLHSNLGADMLYLKESIDATVKQARIDAKARRAKERADKKSSEQNEASRWSCSSDAAAEEDSLEEDSEDDEEVIVRGFSGNATRTERGIKYLGKRLAKYILSMSYPDQPFLPSKKGHTESAVAAVFNKTDPGSDSPKAAHGHSTIHKEEIEEKRPFTITSISFIGHSLGGLIQTYAVAYIQKHSPEFFNLIKPINFVALATPFLGLSNENPLYVKFALDFGLVGRTGQDLGLTWRAPTIARSGWGAIVSNLGESAHKRVMGEVQPESKPLLRILPTGPAHTALKKFRNRTVYSNVVNDGIVPLRTSCLLFLDWQGLGRVEKARRDAGLVETLVGAGWAELTGGSLAPTPRRTSALPPEETETLDDQSGNITPTAPSNAVEVPQPPRNAMMEDDRASLRSVPTPYTEDVSESKDPVNTGPFAGFFSFFKSNEPTQPKTPGLSNKQHKIYRRSQTINFDEISQPSGSSKVTAGHELERGENQHIAPPRTTFFESAHDLINPKIPTTEYIIDPSKRPRAIFHDRVYHPADIPPPPLKKKPTGSLASRRSTFRRAASAGSGGSRTSTDSSPHPSQRFSHEGTMESSRDYDDTPNTNSDKNPAEEIDGSQMRVEEKIARAYHRGLAWRKVLVKLEPDAHNNIIVRRMFANAYGWPVIKHLVDAHFSDSATARTRDEDEQAGERANDIAKPPNRFGDEVKEDSAVSTTEGPNELTGAALLSPNSQREAEDMVPDMQPPPKRRSSSRSSSASPPRIARSPHPRPERVDSVTWSDRDWADSDDSETTATTTSARSPKSTETEFKGRDNDTPRASTPLGGWNWTEKIVGRRASSRKTSPKPGSKTDDGIID
ncbi:lipase ROG1 [Colletotrichum plurivorum]|uniref:Lipase ROG1 n=1 Tax=Colletotrichum plurivorum TaxID=2175906 RepID=A0A8H6NQQ6_9PEZI|nr:lipase ROG1 [Colletotrichum plurivorum]